MLLIAAAMAEELKTGLDLCKSQSKCGPAGCRYWSGTFSGKTILYLKTGAGPLRSAEKLTALLDLHRPERILLIGYAGALAPELRLGDLIALQRASIFGEKRGQRQPLEQLDISGEYELHGSSELLNLAHTAGLRAYAGHGLTSPFIIGDPVQKSILHRRFQALTIDMETAALARVSRKAGVPIASVRAISDEVNDAVLAPFGYDSDGWKLGRVVRVLGAGKWRDRFAMWRENACKARESLRVFLHYCFETWSSSDPDSSWLASSPQSGDKAV